jgi:hypothetical protein
MSKLRAFLIHLAISATVVGTVFMIIFFFWYPNPYFRVSGADDIVRVLIGVDLVLGPVLTLVLFKSGKPRLMFDLSVIAVIQVSALIYGTAIIFQERPYFVVFAVDRFVVVPKKDIDMTKIKYEVMKEKPWRGPILAFANLPEDPRERDKLMFEVMDGAPDIERRAEYWSPLAEKIDQVMARAEALTDMRLRSEEARRQIAAVRSRHENADQLRYLPITSNVNVYSMIFDPATKMAIDIIAVDPWEEARPVSPDESAG